MQSTNLKHILHQLRVLPLKEVARRALRLGKLAYQGRIGKVRARILGTRLSDRRFIRHAVNVPDGSRTEIPAYFRGRSQPAFFIDPSHSEALRAVLIRQSAQAEKPLIVQADKIRGHIFNLLGSGDMHLGDAINWHCDFKTGYCWSPRTYYRDIKIPYGKADIKVPWELSRFSHAVTLGQAYWLTKDEKYAREFAGQVNDWMDRNKPQFGPNWTCAMDVAIRACNWIAGLGFFKDSPELSDEFLLKFVKSLYQHGLHIRANLEYSETLTSNHYLSNLTGLVYLGVLFPEFREAAEWKSFGLRELKGEMEKQVYPDGCNFEASTCYHRLVLELFFFPTLVVAENDDEFDGANYRTVAQKIFGKEYAEKLYRMFDVVLHLLKPNGMMPQIGDNDSGRLHIFTGREVLDMRYLLALGAIFFQEPKFKIREFGLSEEALWVFGERGHDTWRALNEHSLADVSSRAFPDAGWYVMRNSADYAVASCGPNGQKDNGGHAHNDKLSFELVLDGNDVIIDPGTYVYTPEPRWRNTFRSTAFHNTVTVDGDEQNRFEDWTVFALKNDTAAQCVQWNNGGECELFVGEHHGYERLKAPLVHRREIRYDKFNSALRIKDIFRSEGEHRLEWHFHFAPGIHAEIVDGRSVVARDEKGGGVVLSPVNAFDSLKAELFEGWMSPEYGRKLNAQVARYKIRAAGSIEIVFMVKKIG